MTTQLFPKQPRKLRQPSKDQMRAELAAAADTIIDLRAENVALRELVPSLDHTDTQASVEGVISAVEGPEVFEVFGQGLVQTRAALDVDLDDPCPAGSINFDSDGDRGLVERGTAGTGVDSNEIGHRGDSCVDSGRSSTTAGAQRNSPWWRRLITRKSR